MIGIDTNVFVRYLTQDDPALSPKATMLIENRLTEDNPGFISVVTMVETVWVLDRSYSLSDREIAANLELILRADVLVVEHEREVYDAMSALRDGRGTFADSLVASIGLKLGCSHTVTFDRRASRLPGFEFLS